ncbi:hypothetical protein HanIR_Chr04g0200321 [Helianthus annuus]|nr:hypothetical protein HanIR_Chr04g0200321 [Helianthus annuus]
MSKMDPVSVPNRYHTEFTEPGTFSVPIRHHGSANFEMFRWGSLVLIQSNFFF